MSRASGWRRGTAIGLAVGLLVFATMKIVTGPAPGSILATLGLHWPVALLEVVLACLLLGGRWRIGAWGTAVLFLAGIAVALWGGRACGCCGRAVQLDRALHLLLASVGGLLACALLAERRPRQPAAGVAGQP